MRRSYKLVVVAGGCLMMISLAVSLSHFIKYANLSLLDRITQMSANNKMQMRTNLFRVLLEIINFERL